MSNEDVNGRALGIDIRPLTEVISPHRHRWVYPTHLPARDLSFCFLAVYYFAVTSVFCVILLKSCSFGITPIFKQV